MRKISKMLLILLAVVLLLTACGKENTDPEPDIDYNDFIDPVVDRAVADCITPEQISTALGYPMRLSGADADSEARYESEDASCLMTLTLENQARAEFDALVVNGDTVWVAYVGLGDCAYWNESKTELIAYQSGYAVSVAAYSDTDPHLAEGMQRVMQILLSNLPK